MFFIYNFYIKYIIQKVYIMKIGSYIQMERMGSSKSYTVDIIVDESKIFWYVGERRIKFNKEKLTSVGSTKWFYEKIKEITKEEYETYLEKKNVKNLDSVYKSNILQNLHNDNFFRSINSEDLSKLNSFIEELKTKNNIK